MFSFGSRIANVYLDHQTDLPGDDVLAGDRPDGSGRRGDGRRSASDVGHDGFEERKMQGVQGYRRLCRGRGGCTQ